MTQNLLQKLKKLLKKREDWIDFERGFEFLKRFEVNSWSLDLPNIGACDYRNSFLNLRAEPYRDKDETKVKITGEYSSVPRDIRPVERSTILGGYEYPPIPRIKIELIGKL